ncbi:MAG: MFS transporter [Myxococcota bacterium]
MRASTAKKLGLVASLYFSQGLPFGFFTQALPALMRQQGVSLAAIGLSTLLALPWGLKFLWAPWVDRRGNTRFGRRRGWLIPLQLSSTTVLLLLALADPAHSLVWLIVGVLLTNLLSATQDIATDGLAVDLLEHDERGWGNGIQLAGYRVGMIVGGGALLVAFDALGWAFTFVSAAILMLLATIPVWRFSEPPATAVTESATTSVRDAWRYFSRSPQRRSWLVVLAIYKAGDYLGTSMIRPFFIDQGLSLAELGVLLGAAGFSAGLVGALVGGAAVGTLGRRRALLAFGVLQALSVASYALATGSDPSPVLLYGPVIFEHFATGMATAVLFTVMMDLCRPEHAATDYTLQASLVVLATGLAAALGGTTAQVLGYGPNFVLGAAVCLGAVALAGRTPVGTPVEPA